MELHDLKPKRGSQHARKRVGRGPGTGHGKTSGRGEKGQKSRSGYKSKRGFEGGQMPLHRRLPKRGFTNIFKEEFAVVNVAALDRFEDGTIVDVGLLRESGLVRAGMRVKLLGHGDIAKSLRVIVDKFSKSAREKIESAGGSCQEIA